MRHPTGARTRAPRGAASPESIFQRPVFMDSGPRPSGDPGMTSRTVCRCPIALLNAEAVKAGCGAGEEIGFFRCRGAAREPLEGVEQDRIAAGALVDREVALEHAAAGAEAFDAGVDIGPPRTAQLLRGGRQWREVEVEGVDDHRQPAELYIHIRAARQLPDVGAPTRENVAPLIGSDP